MAMRARHLVKNCTILTTAQKFGIIRSEMRKAELKKLMDIYNYYNTSSNSELLLDRHINIASAGYTEMLTVAAKIMLYYRSTYNEEMLPAYLEWVIETLPKIEVTTKADMQKQYNEKAFGNMHERFQVLLGITYWMAYGN